MMRKYICCVLIICTILSLSSCTSYIRTKKKDEVLKKEYQYVMEYGDHNVLNTKDAVPNKEIAVKIAEALLIPIYGEKVLEQRPFNCLLVDESIWFISGTLAKCSPDEGVRTGGVAYVILQKKDGKVLKITHDK